MFGSTNHGINAYATVSIETGVVAADPHKLIVMLFDGAKIAVLNARQHMQAGETAAKGQAISKAIMIIDSGLRASLDKTSGGEIAMNLDVLYQYMSNRQLTANLHNDSKILEEVSSLISQLRDAWEAIAPTPMTAQPTSVAPVPVYDALTPRPMRFLEG